MEIFKTLYMNSSKSRVLVASDIHGHFEYLLRALDKANFGGNDFLIIIGDMEEKGPDSLNVIRYLKKLCEENRATVLMGNVDYRFLWQLDNITDVNSAKEFLDYLFYMRDWLGTSLFDEMAHELGKVPQTANDVLELIDKIKSHFKAELDFMRELPTMLVSDKYIFIHGGIYESEKEFLAIPDGEKNRHKCLKFDRFTDFVREKDLKFERNIVVGHWPVVNNNRKTRNMNPHFDRDINVISIDGGCGTNRDGQLNLLIMPNINCEANEIEHIYYDGLDTEIALDSQSASETSVNICWGDNEVRILGIEETAVEVEHIESGRVFWLPTDYIWDQSKLSVGEIAEASSCTDHRLEINAGDEISVIRKTNRGILAKKNGIVGWYYGKIKNDI